MDISDFILDNPSLHDVTNKQELDSIDSKLLFNLGVKLPASVRNFYGVCNGVSLGDFNIYPIEDVFNRTINSTFLNLQGMNKSLEIGEFSGAFIIYDYVYESYNYSVFGGDTIKSFVDLFVLFEHFSYYLHDEELE